MLALPPAPVVEELLVDGQLDADGAQSIRELEREPARDDRLAEAEALDDADGELTVRLVGVDAAPADRVPAELLERPHLELGPEAFDAHRLHRVDGDHAPAVDLRVDEGVGDSQRHLVAQLRVPNGVADQEEVHGRRS